MDIKKAKGRITEVKALLQVRPGGKADPAAHNELIKLCEEISTSISDSHCDLLCATILEAGTHLFSMRGHERYAKGLLNGPDVLRNKIKDAVAALEGRIINVEAITRTTRKRTG